MHVRAVILGSLVLCGGCKAEPQPTPVAPDRAETSPSPREPDVAENSHELPSLEELAVTMPPEICAAFVRCGNTRFKRWRSAELSLLVGMLHVASKENQAKVGYDKRTTEAVLDAVEKGPMNQEQCEYIVSVHLASKELTVESLRAALDRGTVVFDAQAATECIGKLREGPKLCSDTTDVPRFQDLDDEQKNELIAKWDQGLADDLEPCGRVIQGKVTAGGQCEIHPDCVTTAEPPPLLCSDAKTGKTCQKAW